jgi:hypothetical protein
MSPQDTILNRVKKLLALTIDRGATPEEAASASAKAQALLFEHNLSMAQVDTHELGDPIEQIENIDVTMQANNRTIGWKKALLYSVARHNFCSGVYTPGTTIMHVIGKRSNVQVVEYLAASIGQEIERLSKAAAASLLSGKAAFISSFCNGAVSTIVERLKEQKRVNESASVACTALVVQSKGELDKAIKGFYPHLSHRRRSYSIGNSSGYAAGQSAGRSIGIHAGIGSGSQRAIR